MRNTFSEALYEAATDNPDIYIVVAADNDDLRYPSATIASSASTKAVGASMAVGAGRADPIGSMSFSKVNDPKGIRTPV